MNQESKPAIQASIIVFLYNHEAFVDQCLTSILAEDLSLYELIISDDCSKDATYDRCQYILDSTKHNAARVVLNRNEQNMGGITAHLNKLVQIAQTDLFFPVAGDDWVAKGKFALQLAESKKSSCSLFVSNIYQVNSQGSIVKMQQYGDCKPWDALTIAQKGKVNVGGNTQAIWRRELFEFFGPLPTNVNNEDDQLIFRAALLNGIGIIHQPLYFYRMHQAGVSAWWSDRTLGSQNYCKRLFDITFNIEATYRGWTQAVETAKAHHLIEAEQAAKISSAISESIAEICCFRAVLGSQGLFQRICRSFEGLRRHSNHYFKMRLFATLAPDSLYYWTSFKQLVKILIIKSVKTTG